MRVLNAEIQIVGDQMISDTERKIIDMPASHLKVKHPKTGVEGYRVGLEVFHQLHCVNLLRQVTYRDYYVDVSGDIADGESLQMHTGRVLRPKHCRKATELIQIIVSKFCGYTSSAVLMSGSSRFTCLRVTHYHGQNLIRGTHAETSTE